MNTRQKRLCRALLDFYDASGTQPYPLAQLARKTGYDASDVYDKDSQSGDLWPFDPKARGNYAGMLSFTSGKNPTVNITSAGLVGWEKLCQDDRPAARQEPAGVAEEKPIPRSRTAPVFESKKASESPRTVPPVHAKSVSTPTRTASAPAFKSLSSSAVKNAATTPKQFSSADVADARIRFKHWLKSDAAGKALLVSFEGDELVDGAFDKFFGEFLEGKES